jgi:outer membrane protein insertion porin family
VTRLDPTGRPVINPLTGTTIVDSVPFYTSYITPVGGDTQVIYNIEYRIPIVGPVTLAPFLDIGRSFILNYSQLKIAPGAVTNLYTNQDGAFVPLKGGEEISVVPGTSMFRASTGLEIQVIMPVVNAPFRLIFAYNPLRLNQIITRPEGGPPVLYQEKNHGVKFSVGRTF